MTDLETYQSLQQGTRDEYGMGETTVNGKTVITVTAGEGWCGSCACLEGCCGYGETVFAVDTLQITSLADENGENEEVTFNEGDRLCVRCGEDVYFDNQDEADEAARWDAGERAWELAGDR